MFSKVKNVLRKNLILILTLLIAAAFLVTPEFLNQNQGTSPQPQKVEVSGQAGQLKTLVGNQETYHESKSDNDQIQGASVSQNYPPKKKPNAQNPAASTQTAATQKITLNIDIGNASYSYPVTWTSSMTVYDVLVKASTENKFSLVAKWYGAPLNSYYITEIHGFNCQCWTYVVKDKYGQEIPGSGTGASLDFVNPGNIISWKAI